ncbi:MAG: sigma-70 family RNA polymerase sigma factor [Rhodobacteraceae bacterium]|nr:sigma-70 family RNA polymerase sigma factor [Paracoccaceae bacterium]
MTVQTIDLLVRAVAGGDRAAFERLYLLMERPLFRFARLKLNDPFRSADIVHEVFLEVWRRAAEFQGKSSARTWMFAIAYRKIVDTYRREGRLSYQEELPEQIDDSADATSVLVAAEQAEAVRECLGRLRVEHRLAIELTFYEDMGYREIAEIAGVPEGTVKSRVFHAKQLLMRCLAARLRIG